MRKLLSITILAAFAALALPATATHTHSVSAPYLGGAGGTVDHGIQGVIYTVGIVSCGVSAQGQSVNWNQLLGMGCLGGTTALSDHAIPGNIAGSDWGGGYTHVVASAIDTAFGSSVGLWVCLHSQFATGSCNNFNDVLTRSCGVGQTTADTNDYVDQAGDVTDPGFPAIWAVIFIDTIYIDPATTGVCTASNGNIAVTFSA